MKHTMKRALALVLALVMIIGMAPTMTLHAHAVELTGLSADLALSGDYTAAANGGTASWSAEGTAISGSVKNDSKLSTSIISKYYKAETTKLILTYTGTEEVELSFDYTASVIYDGGAIRGSVYIDGTNRVGTTDDTKTANGTFKKTVSNGDQVTIELNVVQTSTWYDQPKSSIAVSNIKLRSLNATANTTFKAVKNGSYSVNGTTISADQEFVQPITAPYMLQATPVDGYQFLAWYNETARKYVSYDTSAEIYLEEASVIYPVFVSSSTAIFGVGSDKFFDLNEANAAASSGATKTIILLQSGTLAAGDYTISSGNTLLIPFDAANTLYTNKPANTGSTGFLGSSVAWVQPTAYRTLTLANGTNITVNGAISVSGKHRAGPSADSSANSHAGSPSGPQGFISMASGSNIVVNNGGKLYAWGYIIGEGQITAKNGASVYENMQIADFRGGSATTAVAMTNVDWKVFPFSQYYVQNIEVALTLEKGATEYAYTTIFMSYSDYSAEVKFIGEDALFTIGENSTVTKKYNGNEDRLELTVNGKVGINKMNLGISTIEINSGDFVLPITNNITIYVNSGSEVNMTQDIALLPGSRIIVKEGAEMYIPEGYNLYVYDADQWDRYYPNGSETEVSGGNFVHPNRKMIPVAYAPGRTYTRTNADLVDALVDLNGYLTVDGGAYTTLGGANIISSAGTGCIFMNTAPADEISYTYQVVQSNTDVAKAYIPVTSLKLHNGNGNYTETHDTEAGAYYVFNVGACDKWVKNLEADFGQHEFKEKTVEPTCTEGGYTVVACIHCGLENSVHTNKVDALGHSYTNYVSDNNATCTEDGTKTAVCDREGCGEKDTITDSDTKGHKHEAVVTAPTCTDKGYTTHTCSACGDTYVDTYVDATGHSYTDVVTAPTCTAQGYTTHTCSACGDTYVDTYVDALGHTEKTVPGKDATCTETGLTEGKVCTVCGVTTVAQTVINALGHTEETVAGKAATCTETGLTEGKKCTVCGVTTVAQTVIDALGHDWNEGEVTTAPSCNDEGGMTYTCARCGETKTEVISATGHTPVVDEAVDATCKAPGKTEGSHCGVCGAVIVAQVGIPKLDHTPVVDAAVEPGCMTTGLTEGSHCDVCGEVIVAQEVVDPYGHDYDEEVVDATCTDGGYIVHTCWRCGYSYHSDQTMPLGHDEITKEIAPTCTKQGYTLTTCSRCDYTNKTDFVDATGHAYDAVRTEPTCTVEGSVVYTCHCGNTYTETITATGHEYEAVVTDPTCTAEGYTTHTCSVCGDNYVDSYTAVIAHSYTEPVKTVEPTCANKGYTVYKCSGCDATENRDHKDALGHDYEAVVTEPTCTTGGYTTHSCSRCDSTYIDSQTEATGHSWGEWAIKDATCTADGEKRRDCDNCDHYETEVIPATGHTEETVPGKAATCTEAGLTDGVICSVCDHVITEQEEIPATGHNYVDGSCVHCGDTVQTAKVTLTAKEAMLDAEVILRFYLMIPDELLADANAQVILTKDGRFGAVVKTYTMADLLEAGLNKYGEYEVEIGVASGEMNRDVKLEILDGNNSRITILDADGNDLGTEFIYKVTDYARAIFTKGTERQKKVIAAMMVYGGHAQQYFKVDVDNPAYNTLTEFGMEIPSLDDITADSIADNLVTAGAVDGMTYSAMEPFYDSAIYLRVYFKMAAGHTIDEYTFTLTYIENYVEKTMELEPMYDAKYDEYYVDILDIPAAYLDYMYKVTVTNEAGDACEVSTSVLVWAKKVIGRTTSTAAQVNLAKALYYYNQAANVFFGK